MTRGDNRPYRFHVVLPDIPFPFMQAYFYAEPISGLAETQQASLFQLSRQSILEYLASQQVVFGVMESVIEQILKQGYAHHELIAEGIFPRAGTDARFKVLVQGKQREYDVLFENIVHAPNEQLLQQLRRMMVQANTPLVRKISPTRGAPGRDVRGQLLPGDKGIDKPFPPFRQASISEADPSLLVSNIEGIPAIDLEHSIEVLPLVILNRDVKESAHYKGIVVVNGNVSDLVRIRAQADILVLGTVEAAVLLAGRNILIQQGVKGKDMAILKAQGNVVLRYAERMTLEAGNSIYAESLHHCYAVVLGEIYANYILGGEVQASIAIWTDVVGSPGVDSCLACGRNAYLESEIKKVEEMWQELQEKKSSLCERLSSKGMLKTPKKAVIRLHYRNQLLRLESKIDGVKRQLDQLKYAYEVSRQAFIHIQTGIYPNTCLRIHGLETMNHDFIDHQIRYIAGRYGIIPDKHETVKLE